MAISNGLSDRNVLNGGVICEAGQQMFGTGTERQDIRTMDGMASSPAEHRNQGIGRREDVRQIAEMPAYRTIHAGTSSEIWFPPTQIKKMLGDHLRSATRPCRICYHEVLTDAPNPGLYITSFGRISFPFLERDIDMIIDASNLSQTEEVEDTAAPKTTWEVPSHMVELRNPSWDRLLTSLLSRISSELEIGKTGRGILATKPTLILYEPNSVVDPSKCLFSKSPTFGFLDITLPSTYTGGELCAEHDGRKETISILERSEFDCSCLAWFSNVGSTSAPLSSGHRLVLRYTLEHTLPGPICRAMPLTQEILQLRSILTSWTKQIDKVEHGVLAYVLNDRYEEERLGQTKLSGPDQLAVAQLIEACAETGFFLCLSNLSARIVTRDKIGGSRRTWQQADHPDSSFQLGRIVGLDGKELLGDYHMDLEEDDIVQAQPFNDDSYVIDQNSDNYEHCLIKLFRKTVMIIMPLEARVPFFYGTAAPDYNSRVKELLAHFCPLSSSAVEHSTMIGEVRSVCDAVLSTISWDPDRLQCFASGYSPEVHSFVLKAISLLGDKLLLARACPIGFANLGNFKVLEAAAKAFEVNWLNSSLSQQMATMPDFLSRCIAIGKIQKFLGDVAWVNGLYELAMDALKFTTDRDIEGVIKVATAWEKDNRLQSILIPTLKKNLKGKDMVLTLLSQLSAEKQIPHCVFEELMPQSIEHFMVKKPEPQRAYCHQHMSNVLLHCHNLGLASTLLQVVSKISFAAYKAIPNELENDYLGFLGKLATTIDRTKCMALPLFQPGTVPTHH
ncbi:hypothetical protein DL98DRAFT_159588 [Cadophora sp. DSE1049]|nr:hypothetical protein DL98DRAFT_159588 [Cadophora sp. DSE1049]